MRFVKFCMAACALAAHTVWAATLPPTDPRFPTQPVQPGTIQPQPGAGIPPKMKEITIWMFADIKLTVLGPTTVKIDWQSRQGAASYRIIRNGVAIADIPQHAPPLRFVDDELTPGGTATYTVQALQAPSAPASSTTSITPFRAGANGAVTLRDVILEESRHASATTPGLGPVIDITASAVSLTAVRLTWTPPRWSTAYQLWRDRQPLKQGSGNTVEDVSVPSGTHIYAVQAMFAKADGTPIPGPVSQEVSINVGPKLCMPGTKRPCDYMGSAATSHCPVGEQICNEKGDAFGACQDSQYRCSNWDTISFKECAFMGRAKYVGVLRDLPSGDSAEQYVMRHKANVNGVEMNAMAYSRDLWGNHWGSFDVAHPQCFVYDFNFVRTCTSPVTGSVLYQDPQTGRTVRENTVGPCLSSCFGSHERKVYDREPSWTNEPFLSGGAGPPRCETIVSKEFKW